MERQTELIKPKSALWRSICGAIIFAMLAVIAVRAGNMILTSVLAAASAAECFLTADYFRSSAAVSDEGFEITSLTGRIKRILFAETGSVSFTKDSLFIRSKQGKILASLDFRPDANEEVLQILRDRGIPVLNKDRRKAGRSD